MTIAVLLEGTEPGVAGRAETTAGLLGATTVSGSAPPWFGALPFTAEQTGLKLTTEVSGLPRLLAAVRESAQRHGLAIGVRGSAVGVLYAALPAEFPPATVKAVLAELRASAASYSGSVVVLSAPPAVREAVDMWGPVPGLDLMRRVKGELDPGHLLAPGRFVGGI